MPEFKGLLWYIPKVMEKIYYVTTNPGKLFSARKSFTELNIEVEQAKIKVIEPQCDSIEDIVKSKVKQAYDQLGKPCIAQDSGLMIDKWNGFPGAYTEFVQITLGTEGLVKLMDGVENRKASFVRCLSYMGPDIKKPVFFHSYNPGVISETERGERKPFHWSQLTLIFIPEGYDRTLAEMDEAEYHGVVRSHNQESAEEQFAKWFIGKRSTK